MKNVIGSIVVTLVCLLGTVSVQADSSERYIFSDATSEQGWPQMEQALIAQNWLQGDLIPLQPLGDTMAEATKCNPSVCIREFFELNGVVKPGEAVPKWITVSHFKLVGRNGRGWKLPASAISASSASATATVANPESQPQVAVEDGVLKSLIEAMEYSKKELKGNKEALANVEAHLQNQLNEYKKTVDKNDAKLGQQIVATEQTIKSLGEQLAKVEQQVRQNESRTTFLEATADLLGIRMSATETSVATLQGVQNAQGKRLSATESSVAKLQAGQAKQGGRLTKVEESVTDLTKEGGRLFLAEADVLNLQIAKDLQADLNDDVSDNLRYLGYAVVILFFGFAFLIFLLWLKVNSVGDKPKKFAQTEEDLHDDNVATSTSAIEEEPVTAQTNAEVAPATPAVPAPPKSKKPDDLKPNGAMPDDADYVVKSFYQSSAVATS